jgi:hypothetical protein
MRRSRSNQHQKVEHARAVINQALGGAVRRDGPPGPKYVPTTKPTEPVQVTSEAIAVLTLKEAAVRVGMSTREMEAMVACGAVKSLVAGWTVVIPTIEVERLSRAT